MRKPDFFIVGAPRCGTTAMYEYLGQHPEIFMCDPKAPHFFCTDLPFYHRAAETVEEYLAFFETARAEKRLGEASVSYLASRRAPGDIRDFNPSASIIIMLRNPVDMLYSFHNYRVYTAREETRDFAAALSLEARRLGELDAPRRVQQFSYRETARYAQQVKRYLDVFGPDRVHVIIFDDLQRSPAIVYRETLRFLGVHDDFQPEFLVVNPSSQVYSPAVRRALRRPPPLVRWLARRWMPRPARWRLGRALRLLNTREMRRSPLDPDLRRRLQAEFRPEVEQLGALLGRDLTHWSRD